MQRITAGPDLADHMMDTRQTKRTAVDNAFWLVLVFVFFSSCTRPPAQEMADAEYAFNRAVQAGAESYAPVEMTAAQDRWADAKALLESQDFTRARIVALEAKTLAETAKTAADNNRANARTLAEERLALLRTDIEAIMEKAADVKGRAADKIHSDAYQLSQVLKAIETDFSEGRYNSVMQRAADTSNDLGLLNTAIDAVNQPPAVRKKR